jgi:hypothetical protein
VRETLRRWDATWVPAAATALRRRLARLRARWDRPGGLGADVTRAVQSEPAIVGSIAAVLLAAILLATVGEGGPRDGDVRRAVVSTPPAVATQVIGPDPGASVSAYVNRANYDLRRFGQIAGGRATYAIVDLRHYETPRRLRQIVGGQVTVVRAYARVPSKLPTEVRSVPLTGLKSLEQGLITVRSVADATAKSYAALLRSFHPSNRADRDTRHRYVDQRRAALLETKRYSRPARCRCLFALVVQGDFRTLGALASDPDVRVVDPASPVISLTGLTLRPLEPQVTTIVPRTGVLGG